MSVAYQGREIYNTPSYYPGTFRLTKTEINMLLSIIPNYKNTIKSNNRTSWYQIELGHGCSNYNNDDYTDGFAISFGPNTTGSASNAVSITIYIQNHRANGVYLYGKK